MEENNEIYNTPTYNYEPLPDDIIHDCSVVAMVQRFSSCSELDKNKRSDYDCDDDKFRKRFSPIVCFGVTRSGNESYVSINIFLHHSKSAWPYHYSTELRCVASVIDVSGNKRFFKTMTYFSDFDLRKGKKGMTLRFDEYIKKSILFDNSQELLPDDTLTVSLEINCRSQRRSWNNISHTDLVEKFGCCRNENQELCIHMDSLYGQNLCKLSKVLQTMMETPMREKITRHFPVPSKDLLNFLLLFNISKEEDFFFETIGKIGKFYEFADKYDMQLIVQLCRDFMKSVLHVISSKEILNYVSDDIHIISELAEKFSTDESLKDILIIYSDIKRKFENGEAKASLISKIGVEWTCEYRGDCFLFSKIKRLNFNN